LGPEFVNRVVRTGAVVAPLIGLFVATYVSPASGSGFLLGALWGLVNLLSISSLVGILFGGSVPSRSRVLYISFVKFPLLYAIGFLLLRVGIFPLGSLVLGFSLALAIILLKAIGALVAVKLNERGRRIYA